MDDQERVTTADEAQPCPFCGAQPTIRLWHGGGSMKRLVCCPGETVDSCAVAPSVTGSTKARALEYWNRRARPADADAAVAKKYVSTQSHGGMVAVVSNDYSDTYVTYTDYEAAIARAERAEAKNSRADYTAEEFGDAFAWLHHTHDNRHAGLHNKPRTYQLLCELLQHAQAPPR